MNWQQDSPRIKTDFERDGYVVMRGFLDETGVEQVRANVQRYIDEIVPGLPAGAAKYEVEGRPETVMRLSNMAGSDDYFAKLNRDERFVELAKMLLDDSLEHGNFQYFNKPPRDGGVTPPHQDGFYFMRVPNEALTMWLALDVVDDENGCIRYLPGSHKKGFRPHQPGTRTGFSQGVTDYRDEDMAEEHAIHAQPGDVLIHHCMIVHRADPNPSDRRRRALGFIYYANRAKPDEDGGAAKRGRLQAQWAKEGKI